MMLPHFSVCLSIHHHNRIQIKNDYHTGHHVKYLINCVKSKLYDKRCITDPSIKIYVVGMQKNRLNYVVLLSSDNNVSIVSIK